MTSTERAPHDGPQMHRIYKGINKPLTILGVERRLFFLAAVIGAATFNFFGSLLGGLLMFALLYAMGLWASANDRRSSGSR